MEARNRACLGLGNDLAANALADLAANVNTSRHVDAIGCWVVANTALRLRGGVVAVRASLSPDCTIQDPTGRTVPSQATTSGMLSLLVSDVPALGYTTLYARPALQATSGEGREEPASPTVVGDRMTRSLENAFLKVTIAADGSLMVEDKSNGAIYESLAVLEDGSDAGDTYNYSPAPTDRIVTSRRQPADVRFVEAGPLTAVVEIRQVLRVPEMLAPDRGARSAKARDLPVTVRLTLDAGSPLLRFHIEVLNTARDHRLRVLFPTGITGDVSCAETQFDVVSRPICPAGYDDQILPPHVQRILIGAREPEPTTIFPQRSFVDISDGRRGLAVLNRGLPEYEVLPPHNTIALTLFRSTGWIARPDLLTRVGDAGPMMAVPDAQCLRRMSFDFALLAHVGDWQAGGLPEWADRFNSDLLVIETRPHGGPLSDTAGFLRVTEDGEQLKVTAVKRSEDGQAVIVRFFNPTAQPVSAFIESAWPVRQAAYASLNEERQASTRVEGMHRVPVLAEPKKIVTVRLDIERLAMPLSTTGPSVRLPVPDVPGDALLAYAGVPIVTEMELLAEEQRAAELERLLAEKRARLEQRCAEADRSSPQAGLIHSELQLVVESEHRASLEARLSAILMRKKYLEVHGDPESYRRYLAEAEPRIRELGYELNEARVAKRLCEYIVDFYQHSDGRWSAGNGDVRVPSAS
jgi:mannosylglycerate hydrolase